MHNCRDAVAQSLMYQCRDKGHGVGQKRPRGHAAMTGVPLPQRNAVGRGDGVSPASAAAIATANSTAATVGPKVVSHKLASSSSAVHELQRLCRESYKWIQQRARQQRLTQPEEQLAELYLEGCQVCLGRSRVLWFWTATARLVVAVSHESVNSQTAEANSF
jgi:hypothetical protein